MSLLVKICGLKTPDTLDAALEAGADMVGFVFFPPSPRNLGIEAARALGERVKGRAKKVALSVDATERQVTADRTLSSLPPSLQSVSLHEYGGEIVGVAVHVVPRRRLAGAAMTAPVMRDRAEAVLRQEQHLAVPCVRAQRPAV